MLLLLAPLIRRRESPVIGMLYRLLEKTGRWVRVCFEEHFGELILEFLLDLQPVALIPTPHIGRDDIRGGFFAHLRCVVVQRDQVLR